MSSLDGPMLIAVIERKGSDEPFLMNQDSEMMLSS